MAPGAEIRSYRAFGRNRGEATNFALAKALDAAVGDGCDIVNLSVGGGGPEPVVRAAIEEAQAAGVLVVAAAGNDDRGPVSFPANLADVVAASALGRTGTFPASAGGAAERRGPYGNDGADFIAAFSNVGAIDVTAPGVAIVSDCARRLPGPGRHVHGLSGSRGSPGAGHQRQPAPPIAGPQPGAGRGGADPAPAPGRAARLSLVAGRRRPRSLRCTEGSTELVNRRFVLRYRGSGRAPSGEVARIEATLNVLDRAPRMLLVEGSGAGISQRLGRLAPVGGRRGGDRARAEHGPTGPPPGLSRRGAVHRLSRRPPVARRAGVPASTRSPGRRGRSRPASCRRHEPR